MNRQRQQIEKLNKTISLLQNTEISDEEKQTMLKNEFNINVDEYGDFENINDFITNIMLENPLVQKMGVDGGMIQTVMNSDVIKNFITQSKETISQKEERGEEIGIQDVLNFGGNNLQNMMQQMLDDPSIKQLFIAKQKSQQKMTMDDLNDI